MQAPAPVHYLVFIIPFLAIVATYAIAILLRGALSQSIDVGNEQFRQQYAKNATALDVHKDEAPPAWIAAQTLLQTHIANNVHQVKLIFSYSLFAMLIGFGITAVALMMIIIDKGNASWGSSFALLAGTLTQFIAATFLFLYKTASKNAALCMGTLERMNTVGMAICIVRSFPKDGSHDSLTAATLATLAKGLVSESGDAGGSTD